MPFPRLLLISLPPPEVERLMSAAVERHGLDIRLGPAMFPASNWHQTWSDRYLDTPSMRSTLRRVGAGIAAQAFTMVLNRIGGRESWSFQVQGRPPGFDDVLDSVLTALLREGCGEGSSHSPHLTLSDDAPEPLESIYIDPIPWQVREVLLVAGGSHEDHDYEIVDRWALQAVPADLQGCLF